MTLDPRMSECLPPPVVTLPLRSELTAKAIPLIQRDERAVEQLAIALALRALQHIQDVPADEMIEAMSINARAMERAAEILDERARLVSKGGKNGKG